MAFLMGLLAASYLLTPGRLWHPCDQVSKLGEYGPFQAMWMNALLIFWDTTTLQSLFPGALIALS